MNTTKSVYNRLFQEDKVELASERVELSLHDDAMKAYKVAIAARKKSFEEVQKLKQVVSSTLKNVEGYVKANQDADVAFNKLEALVKGIGVPLPPEVVNSQKNIKDGLSGTLSVYVKALKSIKLP